MPKYDNEPKAVDQEATAKARKAEAKQADAKQAAAKQAAAKRAAAKGTQKPKQQAAAAAAANSGSDNDADAASANAVAAAVAASATGSTTSSAKKTYPPCKHCESFLAAHSGAERFIKNTQHPPWACKNCGCCFELTKIFKNEGVDALMKKIAGDLDAKGSKAALIAFYMEKSEPHSTMDPRFTCGRDGDQLSVEGNKAWITRMIDDAIKLKHAAEEENATRRRVADEVNKAARRAAEEAAAEEAARHAAEKAAAEEVARRAAEEAAAEEVARRAADEAATKLALLAAKVREDEERQAQIAEAIANLTRDEVTDDDLRETVPVTEFFAQAKLAKRFGRQLQALPASDPGKLIVMPALKPIAASTKPYEAPGDKLVDETATDFSRGHMIQIINIDNETGKVAFCVFQRQ
jgi:hypothetical protein